jgi:GTPase
MVAIALSGLDAVDLGLWVVDAKKDAGIDEFMMGHLKAKKPSLILVMNKIDLVKKNDLYPMVDLYRKAYDFKEIVPVSALKDRDMAELTSAILKHLPQGEPMFPDNSLTDIPERDLVAEMIREKVFQFTYEEVPYSTAVEILRFDEKSKIIKIYADIWVEKESQKGIVIGKGGEMIKKIGTLARADIEALLGSKVFLELNVKVKENWRDKPSALDQLGIRA